MMRLAAALGVCAAALAAPPAGWKTCGGLPDNYSNTACDTATSTVRLPCPPSPLPSRLRPAHAPVAGAGTAVRHDELAAIAREVGVLPVP